MGAASGTSFYERVFRWLLIPKSVQFRVLVCGSLVGVATLKPVSAGLGDIWQDASFKLSWYSSLPTGSLGHAIFWELDMRRVVAVVVSEILYAGLTWYSHLVRWQRCNDNILVGFQ